MKKTIRNAFAMLLALVIACGGLTAFAETPGDIEWYFGDDEPWIYSYAGTLTVGEETVLPPVSEEKSVYLTVDIEESGYYKITVDSDCWYGMQSKNSDGIYEYVIDYMIQEYGMSSYYYLESGEYIFGMDLFEENAVKVSAEYVGEVTGFEYDKTELENMILGYNIYEGDETPYMFEISSFSVDFSLGEKKIFDYVTVFVYTENQLVKGENSVEIGLFGVPYREKATIGIIEITDIIASVEFDNLEDYAYVTRYYNGNVYAPRMEGETVTVTYTDGTTEVLDDFDGYGYLEKCGYYLDTYYEENDGEWIVNICVAGQNMLQESCVIENATTSENLIEYKDFIFDDIQYVVNLVRIYMNDVFDAESVGDAITAFISAVRSIITDIGYIFSGVFRQTIALIGSFR